MDIGKNLCLKLTLFFQLFTPFYPFLVDKLLNDRVIVNGYLQGGMWYIYNCKFNFVTYLLSLSFPGGLCWILKTGLDCWPSLLESDPLVKLSIWGSLWDFSIINFFILIEKSVQNGYWNMCTNFRTSRKLAGSH